MYNGAIKMQTSENIAHLFLDTLLTGQPEEFISHLTEDAEIHICLGNQLYTDSYAATFMGKNGAHNLFGICKQFLDFIDPTPTDFHHEGDKMIVRGDLNCLLTTSMLPWRSSWMQIWTFQNGQVTKLRIFADFQASRQPEILETEPHLKPSEQSAPADI